VKQYNLFDFCETLVSIQSHDAFIGFYLKNNSSRKKYFMYLVYKSFISKVIQKIFGISFKYRLLTLLKNEPQILIEDSSKVFSKILLQHQNIEVLNKLIEFSEFQDVIIISAGFKTNIVDFLLLSHIKNVKVIANELFYENGICTGKYTNKDCFGDEKVNRLMENGVFSGHINCCYTDSITDLPILNISENQFVVEDNNIIVDYKESRIYRGIR
jgi:HAD superfamily phosphoserine phosphatase-like hydrolase